PVLSQTFVATQIAGVIERGHVVDIYSCGAAAVRPAPPHSVSARVRYLDAPAGKTARLRRAGAVLAAQAWRAPLLFARALDVFRYRRDALSLRLWCAAEAFADGPQAYDVIHCQFGPLGRMAMRLRQIGALRGTLITAFRGYDATELLKRDPHLYDELFRHGELFLPVSDALRRILIAHGADPAKTEVHHSGIDCGKFNFQPRLPADGE